MNHTIEDLSEFTRLMLQCSIEPTHLADLARNSANTVVTLMAIGEGKLGDEPPHAATLHAFLASLRDGSPLADADKIPDRASTVAADQVAYAEYYAKFLTLCRLAKGLLPGALGRISAIVAPLAQAPMDIAKRDENELKDAMSVGLRLRDEARAFYNVKLGAGKAERQASCEQLVKTYQGLRRGTVQISHLKSNKYGAISSLEREEKSLTIRGGSLVESTEETNNPVNRYAWVLSAIYAVIDSFVEGGMVLIDVTKQNQAGAYGTLSDGRQVQFDMQTGLALRAAYLALSDVLSSKQMVAHFEVHFIGAVASDMAGGHSLASATMNHLAHSSWMSPGESAVSMVGSMAAPTPTPAVKAAVAADTKDDAVSAAKLKSVKEHYEKMISDQRAAKIRLEARLRSSQNFSGDDRRGGSGGRSSRDRDERGQPERGRDNRGRNDRG